MFRRNELVRFQHCDPAGIVFYPRYVEMLNATVEDWFADVVGIDFAKIHGELKSAIPVASLEIDFKAPSRLGDILDFDLSVIKVGTSSIRLMIEGFVQSEPRLTARLALVHISKEDYRPRPWTDGMRSRFVNDLG
jgi:4-hydroxybenzoyl-CoA thioesterase